MALQCVAGAGTLLFETRLKPFSAKLQGVFWLDALRIPSELSDELVEGGHVRHVAGCGILGRQVSDGYTCRSGDGLHN